MPLFFLLSGYLYTHGKYTYSGLIIGKTKRLMYPFMSIALLFFSIKYIVGTIVHLGHPVDSKSLYLLLTDPVHSYMPLLWFVYALFVIFVTYPILRMLLPNAIILCLLFAIIVYLGTNIPVFGKSIFNMPFFIVGVIFNENKLLKHNTTKTHLRNTLCATVVFLVFYIARLHYISMHIPDYFYTFILGISGALVIIYASKIITENTQNKLASTLSLIGFYSMTIYLFHTLFESTVRIVFMQKLSFIAIPFEITAITAICAGIVFPLELEKRLLRRYQSTQKYILGIDKA